MKEYRLSNCPFCHVFEPAQRQRETRKYRWDYRKEKPFNKAGFKELSSGYVSIRTTKDLPVEFYGTLRRNSLYSGIVLDWDGKKVVHASFYENCIFFEDGEWTDAGPNERDSYIEETMEA